MVGRMETAGKRRWSFKVKMVADAEEAIKNSYQVYYFIAALYAVIAGTLAAFGNTSYGNLIDPIVIFVLAWFIANRKSRIAALLLAVVSVVIFLSTLQNINAANPRDLGGKNFLFAFICLYAAFKGLQGTFIYHRFMENKVIGTNVWKMFWIFLFYNVALFVLVVAVLFLGDLAVGGIPDNPGRISDAAWIYVLGMFAILLGFAFRVLSWTKDKPLITLNTEPPSQDRVHHKA